MAKKHGKISNDRHNIMSKRNEGKRSLHIYTIHKCFEALSIPSFNIKDPCGWTHMPCFIIKMHLINVRQPSFKLMIVI
jgi:hypothetical protein